MPGSSEFLVVLMTALILPAIAILVTAFLLGSVEGMESVKYVVLAKEPGDDEDGETDIGYDERRCST
jgi:hypothetical protein